MIKVGDNTEMKVQIQNDCIETHKLKYSRIFVHHFATFYVPNVPQINVLDAYGNVFPEAQYQYITLDVQIENENIISVEPNTPSRRLLTGTTHRLGCHPN